MNTPICDFVRHYADSEALRLHMPGHKGNTLLGPERYDLTEVQGADSLYEADGIIRASEQNAGKLFGCETLYSTEGSSHCIRAMLYLTALYAKQQGRKPIIAAGRNVHKTFISGAALLNLQVQWLYSSRQSSYLSCPLSAQELEVYLRTAKEKPTAVYVTSPDYLGAMLPIGELAQVCHEHDVLLLVDNAHGAYLRFLPKSQHPIDLGADLCCDSAHKTLPVLTGGAYLHFSQRLPKMFVQQAKNALALFGSTSPSYLILQSLDMANAYLETYPEMLTAFRKQAEQAKQILRAQGYTLHGDELCKITIVAKRYGYTGQQLAALLQAQNIYCEFADPDFLVLMLTPETGEQGLQRMCEALCAIPKKQEITQAAPVFFAPERVLSIREATLSPSETVSVENSLGRVLSATSVGCPPAVPIVVSGERIDAQAIQCFRYYGIEQCTVTTD